MTFIIRDQRCAPGMSQLARAPQTPACPVKQVRQHAGTFWASTSMQGDLRAALKAPRDGGMPRKQRPAEGALHGPGLTYDFSTSQLAIPFDK